MNLQIRAPLCHGKIKSRGTPGVLEDREPLKNLTEPPKTTEPAYHREFCFALKKCAKCLYNIVVACKN